MAKNANAADQMRGLKLWAGIGEVIFVTLKLHGVTASTDVTVPATDTGSHEADIVVDTWGEAADLERFGLIRGRHAVRVGADQPTEIGAGIRVMIGINDGYPGVTAKGAALVIDAPRDTWDIEREKVYGDRMIAARKAGVRWLFPPTGGHG